MAPGTATALQSLEPGCRLARAAHDDVAQRPAHRLEDRRPGEKRDIGGIELREVLQAEVVHDEPVLTGELRDRATMTGPVAQNDARKVQAGSPTLGSLPELGGDGLELRLDAAEEHLRVPPAERQVLDSDLEHLAIGAQSRDRQLGELAAREHECRSRRHVHDERGEHGGRRARANRLDVVDDQHHRFGDAVEEGREPQPHRTPGSGDRADVPRPQRSDHSGSGRPSRTRQRGRVVPAVESHPREPTGVALGPLRQEVRLPVPGRSDERDESMAVRSSEAVDEPGPSDSSGSYRDRRLRAEVELIRDTGASPPTGEPPGLQRSTHGLGRRSPNFVPALRGTLDTSPCLHSVERGDPADRPQLTFFQPSSRSGRTHAPGR